jgi:hypothetical protein
MRIYNEAISKLLSRAVIIVLITGCTTTTIIYEQPNIPLDQVALINRLTNERLVFIFLYAHFQSAQIERIDGKPVPIKSKLQLLPGQHEIAAFYRDDGGLFFEEIDFHTNIVINVEAGREYQIRGGVKEGVVRVWVEDLETKKVVGISSMILEK